MIVILFIALQACTCSCTSCSICPETLGEYDQEGSLFLIQKKAASNIAGDQSEAEEETVQKPPASELVTSDDQYSHMAAQISKASDVNLAVVVNGLSAISIQRIKKALASAEATSQAGLQLEHGAATQSLAEVVVEKPLSEWSDDMDREKLVTDSKFCAKIASFCPAAQGITILGCMTFIISIFYLINSTSVLMSFTAWTMVSETTSILIAVLLYNLKHKFIKYSFDTHEVGVDEPEIGDMSVPTKSDVMLFLGMQLAWLVLVLVLLFLSKGSPLHLKAFGTIGGHILGFASINAWGSVANTMQNHHSMVLVALSAYFVVVQSVIYIKSKLMAKLSASAGEAKQTVYEHWHEQSYETSQDSFCLGASFLLCMWLRFLITGRPAPLREQLRPHGSGERFSLAMIGAAFLMFAAGLKKIEDYPAGKDWKWGVVMHRLLSDGSLTAGMAAGWCLLFAIHWKVYDTFTRGFFAETVVALLMSLLAIFVVLVCYLVRHSFGATRRTLKSILAGIAMGVGFSWEKVFDESVESQTDMKGVTFEATMWCQAVLCLFIFPAWMLYILPHESEELQEAMSQRLKEGPLPIKAMWSSEGLYDEQDTSRPKWIKEHNVFYERDESK